MTSLQKRQFNFITEAFGITSIFRIVTIFLFIGKNTEDWLHQISAALSQQLMFPNPQSCWLQLFNTMQNHLLYCRSSGPLPSAILGNAGKSLSQYWRSYEVNAVFKDLLSVFPISVGVGRGGEWVGQGTAANQCQLISFFHSMRPKGSR